MPNPSGGGRYYREKPGARPKRADEVSGSANPKGARAYTAEGARLNRADPERPTAPKPAQPATKKES